jgi:hypothetical protein
LNIPAIGRLRELIHARASIAPHVQAELTDLWRHDTSGAVREMYPPSGPGAIRPLDADSLGAAAITPSGLRLVAEGIIDFEVIELHAFAAFGLLFAADDAR